PLGRLLLDHRRLRAARPAAPGRVARALCVGGLLPWARRVGPAARRPPRAGAPDRSARARAVLVRGGRTGTRVRDVAQRPGLPAHEPMTLADLDIARVRADNPSPLTLSGTNTWVYGRHPAWVVDPGPALPEHLDAVAAEVEARGGAAGILLTHDHADHSE